jgi:hypothetical protein
MGQAHAGGLDVVIEFDEIEIFRFSGEGVIRLSGAFRRPTWGAQAGYAPSEKKEKPRTEAGQVLGSAFVRTVWDRGRSGSYPARL